MAAQVRTFTRGGASVLLGAALALAACAVCAEARAQAAKTPAQLKADAKADAKAGFKAEEQYGDQGGEKALPANSRLPNTVMRARLEDTFFKLSNPRFGTASGGGKTKTAGGKALLIDFEVTSKGKLNSGAAIVLRADDGSKAEVALNSVTDRDSGTIQLVGAQRFGNLKFSKNISVPEDIEMYIVRGDDRYEPPSKYMVSNSVVMGKMKTTTKPRDWTADEIARYNKPPLAYKNRNGFPEVGEDVPSLPNAVAPQEHRYVDPEGKLLGLDYHIGNWENRKTVWRLAPVYSADQPKQHMARSIAKKGYAVAGADVNADKYVLGIRLLFGRVKADGSIDTKDGYAGEWLGTPAEGKATPLVNDGRRVLGIHFHQGAIVDRFALVAEEKK